jgi:hypothetical protein
VERRNGTAQRYHRERQEAKAKAQLLTETKASRCRVVVKTEVEDRTGRRDDGNFESTGGLSEGK